MADDALQLRDVVPAEPLLPEPTMPAWAVWLIALGALALVVAFGLWWKARQRKSAAAIDVDPEQAFREAMERIEAAQGLPRHEAALLLSSTLRTYLATVCDDPSLYETHQEFLARHDALQTYPEPLREEVAAILSALADEKYDRPDSDPVAEEWFGRPRTALKQLHQHHTA
jgi:hypothetical protein